MPLTPSAIRNRRETATFEYAGEPVRIEYYASRMGSLTKERLEALEADAGALTDEYEAAAVIADLMLEYVAGWDLAEDDGTPMPYTAERMVRLIVEEDGADLVAAMLVAVGTDVRQRKASGMPTPDASSGTSSPMAGTASGRAASQRNTKSR
jgi:hypothetical protein